VLPGTDRGWKVFRRRRSFPILTIFLFCGPHTLGGRGSYRALDLRPTVWSDFARIRALAAGDPEKRISYRNVLLRYPKQLYHQSIRTRWDPIRTIPGGEARVQPERFS